MRGKQAPKRTIDPDPKYNSVAVALMVNKIMRRGKKSVAQKIVYGALDEIGKEGKGDSMGIFERALKNVGPSVEVRPRRVGGANYQIPFPVKGDRQMTLAMRWIINAAKNRKGKPMKQKLAAELLDASKNEGNAMKKKTDVLRMAEANKAFAHFARFG
jgi:small subunit ribosomal protein S7